MTTSNKVKTYIPDEVELQFGTEIIEGYADGSFVTVEEDTDATSDGAGSDGEVWVSRSNDRRATVTIKLLQTSDSNDALSIYLNLAKEAPNMAGAFQVFKLKDASGRTLHFGANSWVSKAPSADFDRTVKPREWKIRVAKIARHDGGN